MENGLILIENKIYEVRGVKVIEATQMISIGVSQNVIPPTYNIGATNE